jgi:hypothetical protein
MNRVLLAALALGLLAACYDPNLRSGQIACAADGRCPSGFQCAPDRRCWKPGDADVGRAPVQVRGALSSGGGLMHSRSHLLVGRIGASELSRTAASPTHRTLDGVSAQTKGR